MSRDGRGWLCGHLLYLKPEHRGQGLIRRAYFPAVIELARGLGATGFRFLSTLPAWRSVTILHSELYLKQKNGPDVIAFWRRC